MENLQAEIGFDVFPRRHTCDGDDISPEIRLKGAEAPYYAVIVTDPGAPGGAFDHWVIWNIPKTDRIPENIPHEGVVESPVRAVQGRTDFGRIGWNGPCPPIGAAHEFYFNVYGLDAELDLDPGATAADLRRTMEGHQLQYSGFAVATYRREQKLAARH
jgi:Raf kinase inhibitor-like YbhB/YbcL family protein